MTDETQTTEQDHLLSNKLYRILNFLALILFPALATLYTSVALIWDLPAAEKITLTIVAVDTFLGVLIKVGNVSYDNSEAKFDGDVLMQRTPNGTELQMALNPQLPQQLADGTQVTFKVKDVTPGPRLVRLADVGQWDAAELKKGLQDGTLVVQ